MLSPSSSLRPCRTASATALRRDAAGALAVAALLLVVAAAAATLWAGLGAWFVPRALAVFGIGAACVWRGLHAHAPQPRFGAANGITLLRLALVALLAAAAFEPATGTSAGAWAAVALATLAALLDAVDGPIARRRHQASDFGARFDKAGAWVLASGAMRYAFVLAAGAWPWLDRPLPPSWRRKTVCVVEIVTLIVCLGPLVSPALAGTIAAIGLALLAYSFGADVAWLARRRHLARGALA